MADGNEQLIAVVGGGISGLAAAHRLSELGARVTLFESTSRLGGTVLTDNEDGFLIEGGPDSFVSGKGSVIGLAEELGIADRIISSRPEHRGSYVWRQGRLHPLPDGLLLMAPTRLAPLLHTSLLSWKGKLRVLGDLVLPRRSAAGDESLQSFVTRRFGTEVLERIAEPLIAGIHAAEPETMSLLASFPRFPQMEREHRSLILAARRLASQPRPEDGPSYFASFRGGMGELTAALVQALGNLELRTGVAVSGISRAYGGYRLTLFDGAEIEVGGVILAIPARQAADLLSEVAPLAAAEVAGIGQVATATVTLAYRVDQIPQLLGSGFVVPSVEGRKIMGVSYLSNKWEGRVPDERFALLRAFVGGANGQELARADEDRLLATVRDELGRLLGITAHPVLSRVRSWDEGLHQYTLGHLDRVVKAESALTALPGLALAGAAFHGIGLNECIASGRQAADLVLSSKFGAGRTVLT